MVFKKKYIYQQVKKYNLLFGIDIAL